MKSYEQLKNIQEQLTSLSDNLENMYGTMRKENYYDKERI